jgi:hypothetical protein
MKSKMIQVLASVVVLAGCSGGGSSGGGGGSGLSAGQTAALQCLAGSWIRCSDDGNSSTKVSFTVTGSSWSQTTESFNSNDTCSGASNASSSFTAALEIGNLGESTGSTGSTELKMTPNIDIYGCGAGAPTFTILHFSANCLELRLPISAPACDFASRSVALDNLPFTKN